MRIYLQSVVLVIACFVTSFLLPTTTTNTFYQRSTAGTDVAYTNQSERGFFARAAAMLFTSASAASLEQSTIDPALFLNELQIIHLTNLKRREANLPPLRWNRELHLAARWFAEDAITGRPSAYCGHEDSTGRSPGERFTAFGYRNVHAWGENVICGLTTPENAMNGWMNSEGHRRNILHADYREIGVGYYRNGQSGRGYISQEFSYDPNYAPVIIENEAPTVATPEVNLYIYDTAGGEGFTGMGPAVDIMIANDPDFTNAKWQPYAAELAWRLEAGEGWRSVFVKTRDAMGRTTTVFDTVYLGTTIPEESLRLDHACTYHRQLELESLDNPGWPQIQLSLNWQGDNSDATFQDANQIGTEVNHVDAVGGTAHRLPAGTGGNVRYWTTNFYKDMALTAYFRIKVENITTEQVVLEITAQGGGTQYGPLQLKGTDFVDGTRFQEVALPLQFNNNPEDPYLIFNFHHTGESAVEIDTITLFTASMPVAEELEWPVPNGYHRSRGVWARFVQSDGVFSAATDLDVFGSNADITVPTTEPATDPSLVSPPTATPTPPDPATNPPAPTPTPAPDIEHSREALPFTIYLPLAMR